MIKEKERRLIKSTEGVIRQKHRGGLLLHLKIRTCSLLDSPILNPLISTCLKGKKTD